MAAKYWPDGDALGQRLRHTVDPEDRWSTIIGVVPAIKQGSLAESPTKETIYWHYEQRPSFSGVFTLRTSVPPEQLMRAANAVITELDPEITLFDAQPMTCA